MIKNEKLRRDIRTDNLIVAYRVLSSLKISVWLSCGTLLGYYRENDLLLHDTDVDLGLWDTEYTPNIRKAMLAAGFTLWKTFGTVGDGYEESYHRNGTKLDLFYHVRKPTQTYMAVTARDTFGRYTLRKRYIFEPFSLQPVKFLNQRFLVPENPGYVVRQQYGDNWQTPIKVWNYGDDPTNIDRTADASYWDKYYKTMQAPEAPSDFANTCKAACTAQSRILELGCGNGRDSVFLATSGGKVTACDQAKIPIARLATQHPNINWVWADITHLPNTIPAHAYDIIYSRFVLHSLNDIGERRLLYAAHYHLAPGGRLFIEARTTQDPNFGKGTEISPNEFIDTHYRRFIVPEALHQRLLAMNFELEYFQCSKGWAVTEYEDPVVLRIIAKARVTV